MSCQNLVKSDIDMKPLFCSYTRLLLVTLYVEHIQCKKLVKNMQLDFKINILAIYVYVIKRDSKGL